MHNTRELLIREVHGGSLPGRFGEFKMLTMLREHYYCPGMEKDVQDILRRCRTRQATKVIPYPTAYTYTFEYLSYLGWM